MNPLPPGSIPTVWFPNEAPSLEAAAHEARQAAAVCGAATSDVAHRLGTAYWHGADGDRFRERWSQQRRAMEAAQRALLELAALLERAATDEAARYRAQEGR